MPQEPNEYDKFIPPGGIENEDYVRCSICGYVDEKLAAHIYEFHGGHKGVKRYKGQLTSNRHLGLCNRLMDLMKNPKQA